MRIAICDDNIDELNYVSRLFDAYRKRCNIVFTYELFQDATTLLYAAKKESYDLYYLDIIMPQLNGLDLAKEIRRFDRSATIIFSTASLDFGVSCSAVHAYKYMVKPVSAAKLYPVLDTLFSHLIPEVNQPTVHIKTLTSGGCITLKLSEVLYTEAHQRRGLYHLLNGEVVESKDCFSFAVKELLANNSFVQPHRSYLVNMSYISQFKNAILQLINGEKIPVSKRRTRNIREQYSSFQSEH